MNKLTQKSSYKDLKKWFEDNMDQMPETLDAIEGFGIYYKDVKFTINAYIDQVDAEISKPNFNPKESILANTGKYRLFWLYKDLQDKTKWNKPMKKLGY